MIIRINKFEVTLFVALLIIAGLFIVLGLLLNLIMRAAKMLFCKNEHTLSYKVVSFTAPLVLLIMWYIANFTSQYEIDRYILSFWPVVLAILMGVVLKLIANHNHKEGINKIRMAEKQALEAEHEELKIKLEKEKEKNSKKRKTVRKVASATKVASTRGRKAKAKK